MLDPPLSKCIFVVYKYWILYTIIFSTEYHVPSITIQSGPFPLRTRPMSYLVFNLPRYPSFLRWIHWQFYHVNPPLISCFDDLNNSSIWTVLVYRWFYISLSPEPSTTITPVSYLFRSVGYFTPFRLSIISIAGPKSECTDLPTTTVVNSLPFVYFFVPLSPSTLSTEVQPVGLKLPGHPIDPPR